MVECTNCRKPLALGAAFCPHCGADAPSAAPQKAAAAWEWESLGRRRGIVLSVYLVLMMLSSAFGTCLYLFNEPAARRIARYAVERGTAGAMPPDWYYPFVGFTAVAQLVMCIAVWDLLKPGVIGIVVLYVVGWCGSRSLGLLPLWAIWFNLFGLALFLALTLPKWKRMRWLPSR